MWFNLLFSSLSQLRYVKVRISRSVSVSPLEFEITRVNCTFFILYLRLFSIKFVCINCIMRKPALCCIPSLSQFFFQYKICLYKLHHEKACIMLYDALKGLNGICRQGRHRSAVYVSILIWVFITHLLDQYLL